MCEMLIKNLSLVLLFFWNFLVSIHFEAKLIPLFQLNHLINQMMSDF